MANKKEKKVLEEEEQSTEEQTIDQSDLSRENESDQEIDVETAEKETDTEESIAPEVAAIHEDTEAAQEMNKKVEKKTTKKKSTKKVKKTIRSKAYLSKSEEIQKDKKYSLEEAVSVAKKTSYSKFDATLTLSIRVERAKKGEDQIRGIIKLPNGTGKKQKVEIISDDLIDKIKKGYSNFDILVATPADMPKLGQVAKILGPKGKMPNPKDGTVQDDPASHIEDLSEKIARYRSDLGRNIHIPVGKVSWEDSKIIENIQVILKALLKYKKNGVTIAPTMGQSVRIDTK